MTSAYVFSERIYASLHRSCPFCSGIPDVESGHTPWIGWNSCGCGKLRTRLDRRSRSCGKLRTRLDRRSRFKFVILSSDSLDAPERLVGTVADGLLVFLCGPNRWLPSHPLGGPVHPVHPAQARAAVRDFVKRARIAEVMSS